MAFFFAEFVVDITNIEKEAQNHLPFVTCVMQQVSINGERVTKKVLSICAVKEKNKKRIYYYRKKKGEAFALPLQKEILVEQSNKSLRQTETGDLLKAPLSRPISLQLSSA